MEERENLEFAALGAAGAISLGGAGYIVAGTLAGLGSSLIPVAGMSTPAFAHNSEVHDNISKPFLSADQKISVSFEAHQVIGAQI